jgi:hypothetical protein
VFGPSTPVDRLLPDSVLSIKTSLWKHLPDGVYDPSELNLKFNSAPPPIVEEELSELIVPPVFQIPKVRLVAASDLNTELQDDPYKLIGRQLVVVRSRPFIIC